jgi:hypothetical protein
MTPPSIDAQAAQAARLAISALRELNQLFDDVAPSSLTPIEIFGLLAIMRAAKERRDAKERQPAPVLELVRPKGKA